MATGNLKVTEITSKKYLGFSFKVDFSIESVFKRFIILRIFNKESV